jgi:2-polyprenyl-6-methoxyphenol hydroxylase-like FAD-dependent oxidoreductase
VRYSTSIASVDWSTATPDVVFTDGTRGQFDLIVGADGIRSAVRGLVYPHARPAYRSFCARRTAVLWFSSARGTFVCDMSTTQNPSSSRTSRRWT